MANSHYAISLAAGILFIASGCATSPGHIEPYTDVACFERAAVSLSQAIAAAETARGGMVIDAEYNCPEEQGCLTGNPGGYDVTFYGNGQLSRANVCAQTAEVRAPRDPSTLGRLVRLEFLFDWPESEMLRAGPAASTANVTMREAIDLAESAGGKAMAAHVKASDERTEYAIELVDQGQLRVVWIDLNDGTLRQ